MLSWFLNLTSEKLLELEVVKKRLSGKFVEGMRKIMSLANVVWCFLMILSLAFLCMIHFTNDDSVFNKDISFDYIPILLIFR